MSGRGNATEHDHHYFYGEEGEVVNYLYGDEVVIANPGSAFADMLGIVVGETRMGDLPAVEVDTPNGVTPFWHHELRRAKTLPERIA